jgi:hypothetical protein
MEILLKNIIIEERNKMKNAVIIGDVDFDYAFENVFRLKPNGKFRGISVRGRRYDTVGISTVDYEEHKDWLFSWIVPGLYPDKYTVVIVGGVV